MDVETLGEKLVFLISQPRGGSTLLQRVLAGHPEIYTISEPWLLLHPLYALRSEGYEAEYDQRQALRGMKNFLKSLADGEDEYMEALRRMYSYLYGRALEASGKRYFLDKTPRYYLIISELHRLFPKATFIILLRNPLAVLCSILNSWIQGKWYSFHQFKHDLIDAPQLILKGIDALKTNCLIIHYEYFLNHPEGETRRICNKMKIGFEPKMIEYGQSNLPQWDLGDKDGINKYSRPAPERADKWVESLSDPQVWRLADDYLKLLGPTTFKQMGYSYEEQQEKLIANKPGTIDRLLTFTLSEALKYPLKNSIYSRGMISLLISIQQQGFFGIAKTVIRKVTGALARTK